MPDFAAGIAARFPGVQVIQGDAFDLARTLGPRHSEPFAAIISGLPLLNFPVARRRAYVEALMRGFCPGAPLDPVFLWHACAGRPPPEVTA